jgi:hypothetical protein
MSIKRLEQCTNEQSQIFRRIINTNSNSNTIEFGINAEAKKILCFYGFPEVNLLQGLSNASILINEYSFYIIRLTTYSNEVIYNNSDNIDNHVVKRFLDPYIWKLECIDYQAIYKDSVPSDLRAVEAMSYAIVSNNATWGIVKPLGHIGFLVGQDAFLNTFFQENPEYRNQVFDFMKYIKSMLDNPNNQTNLRAVEETLKIAYDDSKVSILLEAIAIA